MKDPIAEAERAAERAAEHAEVWQAVKALLIPFSLFLSCVIAAAGTFLVYNNEALGWLFLTIAAIVIVAAIVGLIRFQNPYRAKGISPAIQPQSSALVDKQESSKK